MSVRLHPDPILARPLPPVPEREDVEAEIEEILRFLDGRMLAVAANQLGIEKRLTVVNFPRAQYVMINPRVVAQSVARTYDSESCLSLPGLRVITDRPSLIHVEYFDRDWKKQVAIAETWHAKCFMHEIDHLDGVIMTERSARTGT